MGTLLIQILPKLTNVLLKGIVKLSKMFIKKIKQDDEDMEDSDSQDDEIVHKNAGR